MERKKLRELNLLDNFLFWTMVSYPGVGEKFVRCILEAVFGRKFGELTIIPERWYPGSDTDMRGARLDVYVEGLVKGEISGESEKYPESEKLKKGVGTEKADNGLETVFGTGEGKRLSVNAKDPAVNEDGKRPVAGKAVIYDMEPDNDSRKKNMLPRRVRFYHSKIDAFSLESGKDYNELKDVYVIMILPYDPFGLDRMVYTVRNQCRENPDLKYEDGAATIFLYTKGRQGEASEELKQLLKYFETTTEENAVNGNLREIHQMVEKIKRDGEVSMKYLRILEHERDLIEQGINQGRQEERSNTERERSNAERERSNAEREKMRADAAERELRDLRKELELLKANMQSIL